jgi:LuxR family maltose regulon positive regulatory protein
MKREKQFNTKNLYFPDRIMKIFGSVIDYPLTIVEAPMGYGKTTTIREYLKNTQVTTLWQRVYDSSVTSFWNGFVKPFDELDERVSKSLGIMGFPNDINSMQEVIGVIEEIDLSNETVLVIDDYHLTNSTNIDNFIVFLGENKIKNLHLVLTLRFARFQKLEELKLKGYLHHITKENFELGPMEIMGYYKNCGINLNNSEANQLYSHTEGWISALYLFMLEYVDKGSYTPEGSIYKLLEKAVYISLSDEIKEFLLTMCVFDGFTLNQSNYMFERENVGEILKRLLASNAFITYDPKDKVYNIHSIFIGFLNECLDGKGDRFKDHLYKKAGQWFMTKGDCFTAMRYFYKCGDYDSILLAIEGDCSNQYTAANKDLLIKYMNECPETVKCRHYYALLIFALHLFVNKELKLFEKTCRDFRKYIEADNEKDLLAQNLRNRLLGELELLLSFSEFNDLKKMSARHQKAWQLMKQPTSIYNIGVNWTFGSPSVLCLYYRESGKLKTHVKDLKEGLPYYYQLTEGHGSGAEYTMEAESYLNQGDFLNAEISVQKALLKAKSGPDENVIICASYIQLLIIFMKGDIAGVDKFINQFDKTMIKKTDYHLMPIVKLCEGRIFAYLNQEDRIPEKLLNFDLCNRQFNFPARVFYNIFYGRLFLIKEEYLKLIGSADYYFSIAAVFSNQLGYIYTYIYLAGAYRKIFKEDKALSSLQKALEIAMPDKQYMPFVENCDYIELILEELLGQGLYKTEIVRILELYKIYEQSKQKILGKYFSDDKQTLTSREMEIAYLAASGITNYEIGRQLYISHNTVKKALKSIYKKLSINNRALLKQYINTKGNK